MSSILLCGLRACSKIMESILRSALKAPFWYTMIILKLKRRGISALYFLFRKIRYTTAYEQFVVNSVYGKTIYPIDMADSCILPHVRKEKDDSYYPHRYHLRRHPTHNR